MLVWQITREGTWRKRERVCVLILYWRYSDRCLSTLSSTTGRQMNACVCVTSVLSFEEKAPVNEEAFSSSASYSVSTHRVCTLRSVCIHSASTHPVVWGNSFVSTTDVSDEREREGEREGKKGQRILCLLYEHTLSTYIHPFQIDSIRRRLIWLRDQLTWVRTEALLYFNEVHIHTA